MALGHARIKVENATRSACATTTVDTVLLTVDRGTFTFSFLCHLYLTLILN